MTENPTVSDVAIDVKYSYRPQGKVSEIIFMPLIGVGGIFLALYNSDSYCFLKGLVCMSPLVTSLVLFAGGLMAIYSGIKSYKNYVASKRDQYIEISNTKFSFPNNTLKPSETLIDFRAVKDIDIFPLTGNDRKIVIRSDKKDIIIEEKSLEYEGEFEEIWKYLNLFSKNRKRSF